MSGWYRLRTLAIALACVVSAQQSASAQVRGTATFKDRVKLPADAVFEASLEDVSLGGGPGSVVGRTRIERPGNPIRFTIDYDASRIEPRHVYMVRARVLAGSRQLYAANHSDLVLTWGNGRRVSLLLQRSSAPSTPEPGELGDRATSRSEIARTELSHGEVAHDEVRDEASRGAVSSSSGAAIFSGNLPCADCTAVRHQLDLFPSGSYFLRRRFLGKGREAFVDEIGRWTLSRDGSTLTLRGTSDTTRRLAIGKPDTLQVLGASGKPTRPTRRNTLTLTNRATPLEPRLEMRGMYTYMADAGRFTECSTRQSWPVAQEGDNAALESAYSRARRRDAEGTLVRVVGRVTTRPRMDGGGRERTLVVERFLDIRPGEPCGSAGTTNAALENTYWRLSSLGDRPVTVRTGQQAPYLVLNAGTGRMIGWTGCGGVSGRYRVDDQHLAFTTLMTTRSSCVSGASGAALERRYLAALRSVSRTKITGQRLELFDARDKSLARFEAGRRND